MELMKTVISVTKSKEDSGWTQEVRLTVVMSDDGEIPRASAALEALEVCVNKMRARLRQLS
jgi:hypothetical protein